MTDSESLESFEVVNSKDPFPAAKTVNEASNINQQKTMIKLQKKELEEDKKDHQSYLAIKKSGDHLHVNVSFKVHQW